MASNTHAVRRGRTGKKKSRSWTAFFRLPKWILVPLMFAVVLGAAFLWLRDSSLVAVKKVQISGFTGGNKKQAEKALTQAAMGMTTLHVDQQSLDQIAVRYPIIKEIDVHPLLFHGLKLTIIENVPVAVVSDQGKRTLVAADGTLLKGIAAAGLKVPVITVVKSAGLSGRITGTRSLATIKLMAAAPAYLRKKAKRAFVGPRGLTVILENGVKVYFGNGSDPHLQWVAVARILAEPTLAGITAIDVSAPNRPAVAGGSQSGSTQIPSNPTPLAPQPAAGSTPSPTPALEPTQQPAQQPAQHSTPQQAQPSTGQTQSPAATAPTKPAPAPASTGGGVATP